MSFALAQLDFKPGQPKNNYFLIKTELLCYGLKVGEKEKEALRKQNPFGEKRAGFSAGGFFILENGFNLNAPIYEEFVQYSPYSLKLEDSDWKLYKDNEYICKCNPVPPPNWYWKNLKDGTPAARIVQRHGNRMLATAVWSDCSLFAKGEECKFCLIGLNKQAVKDSPRQSSRLSRYPPK